MSHDRYGSDVLNTDWRAPRRGRAVEIEADKGLVVEEVTTADIARAWTHILRGVRTYGDLEPSLFGRVEELIDFVTRAAS